MASGLIVRLFNPLLDPNRVEELERRCETGPTGAVSLFADLMGDPLCRVRHFISYIMLVAEVDDEIVGVIRGGIKEMVCGKRFDKESRKELPIYCRAAYILGLRVSPSHRRMGIGLELAKRTELWCKEQGARYAYMATEKDNKPSVNLFIEKLSFKIARTPSILVHPVFQHHESIPTNIVRLTKLSPTDAIALYRSSMSNMDFFPKDLEAIFNSKLYGGTWVATLQQDELCGFGNINNGSLATSAVRGGMKELMEGSFTSWAVLSIWKCNEIFRFQVSGVSWRIRALAAISRCADRSIPWLQIPSFPDVFRAFGMQFLFGVHGEGKRGHELVGWLCKHARNVARENNCQVVMAELGSNDPLLRAVPQWKSMSSSDDLWCVKKLEEEMNVEEEDDDEEEEEDWLDAALESAVFVDPRDV